MRWHGRGWVLSILWPGHGPRELRTAAFVDMSRQPTTPASWSLAPHCIVIYTLDVRYKSPQHIGISYIFGGVEGVGDEACTSI